VFLVDLETVGPGRTPRVISIEVKSHEFLNMTEGEIKKLVRSDLAQLKTKYKGPLVVRRDGHALFEKEVEASELYLVYDANEDLVNNDTMKAITALLSNSGVKVCFK